MPIKMKHHAWPSSPLRAMSDGSMIVEPVVRDMKEGQATLRPSQMDAGSLEAATSLYRDTLAACRQKLGDDHEDTLTALNNLGTLLLAQGKADEAAPLMLEALELSRALLGAQHAHTLVSMGNLGTLRRSMGDLDAYTHTHTHTHIHMHTYTHILGTCAGRWATSMAPTSSSDRRSTARARAWAHSTRRRSWHSTT